MLKYVYIIVSALAAVALCLLTDAFAGLAWLWMLPTGFAGCYIVLLIGLFVLMLIMASVVA